MSGSGPAVKTLLRLVSGRRQFEYPLGLSVYFNLYGACVQTLCPPNFPPISPNHGTILKENGSERSTPTLKSPKLRSIFTLFCKSLREKKNGLEIRKLRACNGGDCTFGARVRNTSGARSRCVPERKYTCLLAQVLRIALGINMPGCMHEHNYARI